MAIWCAEAVTQQGKDSKQELSGHQKHVAVVKRSREVRGTRTSVICTMPHGRDLVREKEVW